VGRASVAGSGVRVCCAGTSGLVCGAAGTCWAGTAVPDRGVLLGRRCSGVTTLLGSGRGVVLGRRAGGVATLPGSVTTRGAASNMLRDRLTDTMLCCSTWGRGAEGSAWGSPRRRVDGADTAE